MTIIMHTVFGEKVQQQQRRRLHYYYYNKHGKQCYRLCERLTSASRP